MVWQGRKPVGNYGHWCREWDDLPIDETCLEMANCCCFDTPEFQAIKAHQNGVLDELNEAAEAQAGAW
jgi:hypothetical protein